MDAKSLGELAKRDPDAMKFAPFLRVQVGGGKLEDIATRPALAGRWRAVGGVLRFEPRFPLVEGVPYRATIYPQSLLRGSKADEQPLTANLMIPKAVAEPTTVVERVYPTRNKLPENTLKLYLHFSAPMARGGVYEHIRLLDSRGKPVELPFLELDEELWDPAGKRLTLLFDPGRVKRGLKPRDEAGPALEEGKRYTLVIDRKLRDAEGRMLKAEFRKSFSVGPPDEEPIDPQKWKLTPPPAGQAGPLSVRFPLSLDHALLNRVVWVVDADGRRVPGSVAVSEEETLWRFTPEKPWQPGKYRLVADTILEDLCGNRIGRPFEIDVFRPVSKKIETKTVELPFDVK